VTTPLRAASPRATSANVQGSHFGATRIAQWLLVGPAQQADGPHAGAVAGWIDAAGKAEYVYPEITGYFLQWLAWMARSHGRQRAYVARAEAALHWIDERWLAAGPRPPTRIYVDATCDDWRNDALFTFDLAMALRGIGAAAREGLLGAPEAIVDRVCGALARMIVGDGHLDACLPDGDRANLPDRWSTRRGPFLAKAAAGILAASEALQNVPAVLVNAARRSFDTSVDALARAPHDETHPFLYAIEGFLARPADGAFATRLPTITAHFDALLERSGKLGRVPETAQNAGPRRLDIVAQALRAGLLLDVHRADGISRRRELDRLADTLAQYVRSDGALPFSPDADVVQLNVWTAMFAEQALSLAACEPQEIARCAASPTII
jgi:hypothetical protein